MLPFLCLTDIPEPVVITDAFTEDGKIILKWKKPEENGAAIILYSKYQRVANDEQWTNRENITDPSKRSYSFNIEKGKKYEFVMTAMNKYGESVKGNVKEVEVLAGKNDFTSYNAYKCSVFRNRLQPQSCRGWVLKNQPLLLRITCLPLDYRTSARVHIFGGKGGYFLA